MISRNFKSSSVRRKLIVGGICLGLVFGVPVVANGEMISSNIMENATEGVKQWFLDFTFVKSVKKMLSSKGVEIHVLKSNQEITPREIIYIGFIGSKASYRIKLRDSLDAFPCSSKKESESEKTFINERGKKLYYHFITFTQCKFKNATKYTFSINSIDNYFIINNKECLSNKTEKSAYNFAVERSSKCLFEAYQIVLKLKNEPFAQSLSIGRNPTVPWD